MLSAEEKQKVHRHTYYSIADISRSVIACRGVGVLTKSQVLIMTNEIICETISYCLSELTTKIPTDITLREDPSESSDEKKEARQKDFPAIPSMEIHFPGQRIKETRKAANLTQAELGERCGLATITIQQYERGVREPKLAQLQALATALGVSPAWLAFGEEEPPPPEREEATPMNELDRFRMAAAELELGDRAAVLISRVLNKLQNEVVNLGDDCPGGAHRIEALSGVLASIAPVLDKLGAKDPGKEA